MTSLNTGTQYTDTNNVSYTSAVITVGTSAVELFTGGSRNNNRQVILIHNVSNNTVFVGPSTVTTSGSTRGIPLVKDQFMSLPAGSVAIYAIAGSSSNDIVVQELA